MRVADDGTNRARSFSVVLSPAEAAEQIPPADFVIDPAFTLDTDYSSWKTGNMHRIKRWPLIHSEGLRRG